ncbi:MAG: type II toxin-antitoxin system HicA family toxin [Verrucomicrobiota bacterium]
MLHYAPPRGFLSTNYVTHTVRQTGSHIRMSKDDRHVTVPNHPDIAPKTLQSILKQANVSLEDFVEAI